MDVLEFKSSPSRQRTTAAAVQKASSSSLTSFLVTDGLDADAFYDLRYQASTPSMTLGSSSRSVSSSIAENFWGDSEPANYWNDTDWIDWTFDLNNANQSITHSLFERSYIENAAQVPTTNSTGNYASTILWELPDQENGVDGTEDSEEDNEDEDDDDDEDEEDEEDEWSWQDNELEHTVIRALGGDLSLAAHLIPVLQKSAFSELTTTVTQKVGPWRRGVFTSSHGVASTESEQTASSHGRTDSSTRKRQRAINQSTKTTEAEDEDERNDEHDDSDDGRPDPKRRRSSPTSDLVPLPPRLACPFYKRNPVKYSAQSTGDSKSTTNYRACAGPGFKSIQRLKEHLKRKHYPVQCDRCYEIFSGMDRSACVLALEAHRQLDVPCERKFSSLKEGISDAQWVSLEKKRGKIKNAESSRIEKWFDIWNVLFPGVARPAAPWYENQIQSHTLPPPSRESSAFAELFSAMLDHQVNQQYICFLEGSEDVMKSRIETLAQKAFTVYVGINGPLASTNSSSSRSPTQNFSILGSSFQRTSTFGTTPSLYTSSSAISTHTSGPRSQAPSLDIGSMNVEPPRMSMGPPPILPPQSHATEDKHVTEDKTPFQYSSNELPDISNHPIDVSENPLYAENTNALHSVKLTRGATTEDFHLRGRQKSI